MSENYNFKTSSEIQLTRKDAFAVFSNLYVCGKGLKFWIVLGFFLSVFYNFFVKDGREINELFETNNITLLFFGLTIALLVCIIFEVLIAHFHSAKLKSSPLFSTPVILNSSENGFITNSERGNVEYKWSDFKKFKEIKNYFYLITHEGMLLIFPKRNFEENDLNNFRAAIQENIKK